MSTNPPKCPRDAYEKFRCGISFKALNRITFTMNGCVWSKKMAQLFLSLSLFVREGAGNELTDSAKSAIVLFAKGDRGRLPVDGVFDALNHCKEPLIQAWMAQVEDHETEFAAAAKSLYEEWLAYPAMKLNKEETTKQSRMIKHGKGKGKQGKVLAKITNLGNAAGATLEELLAEPELTDSEEEEDGFSALF